MHLNNLHDVFSRWPPVWKWHLHTVHYDKRYSLTSHATSLSFMGWLGNWLSDNLFAIMPVPLELGYMHLMYFRIGFNRQYLHFFCNTSAWKWHKGRLWLQSLQSNINHFRFREGLVTISTYPKLGMWTAGNVGNQRSKYEWYCLNFLVRYMGENKNEMV